MDPLYELLVPHQEQTPASAQGRPLTSASNAQATSYLNRLSTLSLSDLTSTEPASLLFSSQSHVRNLQALSKRSHKAIISSSSHLQKLQELLPAFGEKAVQLKDELPGLEDAASGFAKKYDRSADNEVLDRRKRAMLLSRNVDRVSDVLELPTLLSSTVAATQAANTASASSSATSYASALDLHAHIKRLTGLYPNSELLGRHLGCVREDNWACCCQKVLNMQFLSPALRIVRTTLRSPTLSANNRMSTAARRFNGHL
jgi:hypothetical protein